MKVTLSKLDKLVKEGKILEAFDTYFSEEVITYDERGNKTSSKAEKRTMLEEFLKEFTHTEEITLSDSFVDGDTSYSGFRFVFGKSSGEKFQWDEVIIRKWKDNLVISEFYSNQNYDELKASLVRKVPEKKAAAVKKTTASAEGKKLETSKETPAAVAKKATPKKEKTATEVKSASSGTAVAKKPAAGRGTAKKS